MTKTTDESKYDVPLQGLYSVRVMCLRYNHMREAEWCDKALVHMKELRGENAKLRGENAKLRKESNYSYSKPTKTLEEYKKENPQSCYKSEKFQDTEVVFDLVASENQIRKEERERCAQIVRSFKITPWFLDDNGKGYEDKERARIENEKIEKIALAVERG